MMEKNWLHTQEGGYVISSIDYYDWIVFMAASCIVVMSYVFGF